ncbi:hypothetical protein PMM47T1_07911 [Pseudomonas sp. M47T1]|uniref:FUSC family protein n=1 Tax=unclassified Pseudomonas TaxID=196821 RepID=UPI0002607231|nr:FUSC family protein [Pseudomonas sp. M47T1]EIK97050.1 hypothetical protein PMM47T1_07911 [Pseudomonas sp. M47T1]
MKALRLSRLPILRHLLRPLLDPHRRYLYARYIHAGRVAVGLLASILLTTGLSLPHGEWASVTLLIVIGGLQHQGNIGRKSLERAYGTLIGAAIGLLLVVQQGYLHEQWLTYVAMSTVCGFFAYHAIGKGGYIALLSAITVFIVAGHGDNPISDGLWRLVDILIGIALALAFSFAIPLYAVYSWRFSLAKGLRGCAKAYGRILNGHSVTDDEHLKLAAQLNAIMVQLRSLMPSVSKEVRIPLTELEVIQGQFRLCLSTLELLSNLRPREHNDWHDWLHPEHRQINRQLIAMARALETGATDRLARQVERGAEIEHVQVPDSQDAQGFRLLTLQLATNLEGLRQRLHKSSRRWNL